LSRRRVRKDRGAIRAPWLFGITVVSVHVVVLLAAPAFSETVNRVVAVVNDEVITLLELNKRIMEVTGLSPADLRYRDEKRFLDARRMILEAMIDEKIAQEKIEELNLRVTPREIDDAIERIKEQNHMTQDDLMAALSEKGKTYETYRSEVKKDLERIKLINLEIKSKIMIRDEQIERYYQEHQEKFARKGKVHLATIILLKKASESDEETMKRGREIMTRLEAGEDFGKLARDLSSGPGAQDGGDLGEFEISQLEPELQKIVMGLEEGEISDLIVRPDGIQIIKMIDRDDGHGRSLEEARGAIYSILYQEEINRRYSSWIKELRERSYTKIIF
jgi:peptidyl-prolyl cis-trans isomerase SurA